MKKSKTILLIGDDSTLMGMLERTIKKARPEMMVEIAMSGVLAMKMINNAPGKDYDLAVMTTLRLLDVPSYEILEHLRRMHPRVRVLVLSGGPIPPDGYPMHRFMVKPMTHRKTLKEIGRLMAT